MIYYIIFDFISLSFTFFIIRTNCRLSFFHPGCWLLLFHFLVNTLRYLSVYSGADLLDLPDLQGPNINEFNRAFFWTDISLISAGILIAIAEKAFLTPRVIKEVYIDNKILNRVLIFTIPIGIFGAATQLFIPSVNLSSPEIRTDTNWGGYSTVIQSWFGLSMLALIYFKGFKKKYIIPLMLYLFVISLQGYARYRLILPLIFLTGIYLQDHYLKWPPKKIMLAGLVIYLIFAPLKEIGILIRRGGNFNNVTNVLANKYVNDKEGNNVDQMSLDEYAITLTEIDKKGKFYYGATILPIIYSPIPRTLWPGKPALNQWQVDISTSNRPFAKVGAIPTIYGEAYANFGYLGIIFIPAFLFYLLTIWYIKVKSYSIKSIEFFFYLLVLSCLIQILRDGLRSMIVFPIINNMPLFLIFIIHKILKKPHKHILRTQQIDLI